MKRMWSKNELKKIIKTLVESSEWSFEGDITFNGLTNFKDDVDIDGDLSIDGAFNVTGSINGEANPSVKPIYCHPINFNYSTLSCASTTISSTSSFSTTSIEETFELSSNLIILTP